MTTDTTEAVSLPDEITSNSRDGLWSYTYDRTCGYYVTVTHRPTGRTTEVRGGVSAARRMAKSGELLGLLPPATDL